MPAGKVYGRDRNEKGVKDILSLLQTRSVIRRDTGCMEWNGAKKKCNDRHCPWIELKSLLNTIEREAVVATRALLVATGDEPGVLVASHLCHNEQCVNPEHVVFERQGINVERTRCRVDRCHHEPKCLRSGSLAGEDTTALVWDSKTLTYKKIQQ